MLTSLFSRALCAWCAQGEKFHKRFDANAYIALTRMIDSHHVGRGRGEDGGDASVEVVLKQAAHNRKAVLVGRRGI